MAERAAIDEYKLPHNLSVQLASSLIRGWNRLAWFMPVWAHTVPVGEQAAQAAGAVWGSCNSTHGVLYDHYSAPLSKRPADALVFPNNVVPSRAQIANHPLLAVFSMEPPHHQMFLTDPKVMKSYHVDVGYHRRSGIWSPYLLRERLWEVARAHTAFRPESVLSAARNRTSVGIYVTNCRFGPRNAVIEALLKRASSKLRVSSYGKCHRNVRGAPSSVNFTLESMELTCHEHRFMLAIENSMCEDYVTEKLMHAVRCGAVPIVASYQGVPNYEELFGPFPRIELRLRWKIAPQPEPPIFRSCCPWPNPNRIPGPYPCSWLQP